MTTTEQQAAEPLTAVDYEEVLADHRRLVRELDVLLNGEGAAKQASLCDIVGQLKAQKRNRPSNQYVGEKQFKVECGDAGSSAYRDEYVRWLEAQVRTAPELEAFLREVAANGRRIDSIQAHKLLVKMRLLI